jgi:hypothetical protein
MMITVRECVYDSLPDDKRAQLRIVALWLWTISLVVTWLDHVQANR